jgi:hypothetical protein
VGPIRVSIDRVKRKPAASSSHKKLVMLGGVFVMAAACVLMMPRGQVARKPADNGSGIGAPLFHALPPLACATVDACAARAHERYAKGRQYENLAANDPGNWYRAAVEYAYAAQLRNVTGTALPEIADAEERVDRAAHKAQQLLEDARFELQTAIKNKNGLGVEHALGTIERVVPEPTHPIRLAIAEVRQEAAREEAARQEAARQEKKK